MARGTASALVLFVLAAAFMGQVSQVFVPSPATNSLSQPEAAVSSLRTQKGSLESMTAATLFALAAEPAFAESSQYDYDGRVLQGQLAMVGLSVSAVGIVAALVIFGGKFLE
eukprot:CAMPEP_0178402918 /NCGR_PEP_ID=MMETSP0689_2-20121128/17100_1 /TAXON_ID=160604 /ORGANISM="Amphidinium massartii, Strain CS-259" /LENGTH=111 /DNA_ID=CAMNT_0020023855 /DNA_START=89 /DNA_END=424 /DNA_ORIENTATION=-